MGQRFGAQLAKDTLPAVSNAMGKPSTSSPCIRKGPYDEGREVRRLALTQKVKGGIYEAKGDMALKVFEKPTLSPSMEKEIEGVGVEGVQEKLVGLFLGLLGVRL